VSKMWRGHTKANMRIQTKGEGVGRGMPLPRSKSSGAFQSRREKNQGLGSHLEGNSPRKAGVVQAESNRKKTRSGRNAKKDSIKTAKAPQVVLGNAMMYSSQKARTLKQACAPVPCMRASIYWPDRTRTVKKNGDRR